MWHIIRTLAVLTAAGTITGALTMTGAVTAPAEAAIAGSCPPIAVSNQHAGYGIMKGRFNLKVGPYAGPRCKTVASVGKGKKIYFHCFTRNSHGHLWVYGRVKGTGITGFMSMDNFSFTYYGKPLSYC
ncbi:hypothetical protein ACFYY8_39585 [Streptosporangium sp. NPDC001559]|uniref:hypothetical protein n=1 Tax=Streptosporangium sp. NPDC001559 TaxID=3366187 RepID=UPI0036EC2C6C